MEIKLMKKITLTLLSLCSAPLFANTQTLDQQSWYDLSNPREIFSGVGIAAGSEGVNLSASYGGYLNGLYKQRITVEAINDLDYYAVEYMAINNTSNSGFSIETTWDRDEWGFNELDDVDSVNNVAGTVFSKVPLLKNEKLALYPELKIGLLWGDHVDSTTYIEIETPLRYRINDRIWVGATPTYTYAMQGYDINDWNTSIEAAVQLSPEFTFSGQFSHDDKLSFKVLFTF